MLKEKGIFIKSDKFVKLYKTSLSDNGGKG